MQSHYFQLSKIEVAEAISAPFEIRDQSWHQPTKPTALDSCLRILMGRLGVHITFCLTEIKDNKDAFKKMESTGRILMENFLGADGSCMTRCTGGRMC